MLNPVAVNDRLKALNMAKTKLCAEVGVTPGQLGDALNERRKGISSEKVEEIARVLGVSPETIAPGRLPRFVSVKPEDPEAVSV